MDFGSLGLDFSPGGAPRLLGVNFTPLEVKFWTSWVKNSSYPLGYCCFFLALPLVGNCCFFNQKKKQHYVGGGF